ncbi:MAG: hypothetical protein H6835_19990 [Planctomycetes bacterium]|nr:hypothetical protein [Planctomycetota bacterium]
MKHFPLFVAALLGLAFSAPAQFSPVRVVGQGGRAPAPIVVAARGGQQHGSHQRGPQQPRPVARNSHQRGGHWETITEQVLVPGHWEQQHVPPSYGWIYSGCGHRHWGLIDRGGCRNVWIPDRWETRCRQVWVAC